MTLMRPTRVLPPPPPTLCSNRPQARCPDMQAAINKRITKGDHFLLGPSRADQESDPSRVQSKEMK